MKRSTVSNRRISTPHFISHPYDDQFVLFDLPPEVVEGLECYDPNAPLPPWHERPDQKFYGASMRLQTEDAQTFDVFQIWTAEEDHWKIVAFHVDPHADTLDIPRLRPATIGRWSASRRCRPTPTSPPPRRLSSPIGSSIAGSMKRWSMFPR